MGCFPMRRLDLLGRAPLKHSRGGPAMNEVKIRLFFARLHGSKQPKVREDLQRTPKLLRNLERRFEELPLISSPLLQQISRRAFSTLKDLLDCFSKLPHPLNPLTIIRDLHLFAHLPGNTDEIHGD